MSNTGIHSKEILEEEEEENGERSLGDEEETKKKKKKKEEKGEEKETGSLNGVSENRHESDESDEEGDVEEIKDDEDSDIMEVDAEDPLKSVKNDDEDDEENEEESNENLGNQKKNETHHGRSNFKGDGSHKLVLIDTESILAGKNNSRVTISPAGSKLSQLSALPSGVTISQMKSFSGKGFTDKKASDVGDRHLTDDTYVVEAPSFIVPYVYEKPPLESFADFKSDVKRLMRASEVKKSERNDGENEDEDEVIECKSERKTESFFDSALGTFFSTLGMNLVQELVQSDLLKQQIRRSLKDKSSQISLSISSLKDNLSSSKKLNAAYRFELLSCNSCSFKSESSLALAHHYEVPHMRGNVYLCSFCSFETKVHQDILTHMMGSHGIRGRIERPPYLHTCPQCPYEDNMKGKLTRHKTGCDKRFRPERNQEPSFDWEPPAKISKPHHRHRHPGGNPPSAYSSHSSRGSSSLSKFTHYPSLSRGRGRPVGFPGVNRSSLMGQILSQTSLRNSSTSPTSILLPHLNNSGSVTIQSLNQRGSKGGSPSISITPLPPRSGAPRGSSSSSSMKPGQPVSGSGRGNLVICEICDGFIKDLEQLRNHMQWIHKVKIHPKMIYNRPPLNCQKCQYRFFTDQGLERHLLGSHGLVTASMQDLANKGQDSGRCPVCGKVYQWKLLNHVAKDHQKTLKPAHLSYKCTVCTATFGQYKLFESHVYTAHSGAAKKGDKGKISSKSSGGTSASSASSSSLLKSSVVGSDDITVIQQKKNSYKQQDSKNKKHFMSSSSSSSSLVTPTGISSTSGGATTSSSSLETSGKTTKENDPDVIELDDEEEIDDVEDNEGSSTSMTGITSGKKSGEAILRRGSSGKSNHSYEGVEEIQEDEEDEQ